MAQNRLRILDAAARLFREKGFDAVGVAEVMKAAGLTHGGFYGHFASKDDLIAHTLAHAFAATAGQSGGESGDKASGKSADLTAFMDGYLSPGHRDHPDRGCPMACLAAETRHQTPSARAAMTAGLRAQIDRISAALPAGDAAERRRAAMGSWAAMVGAVILARAVDDPAFSTELLEETRAWIDARTGAGPDGT